MVADSSLCIQVVEALRKGIPPERGVRLYSVGNEKLIEGIRKRHLIAIADQGIIRFTSGSWGAGKTHLFCLLRETAFEDRCLVSSVELNVNEAALDKFQSVFYAIVRNVSTPLAAAVDTGQDVAPFRNVLAEALSYLATGTHTVTPEVPFDQYESARTSLMSCPGIDIDFKKMVQHYWQTFLPESPDPALQEQKREEILQWFGGEGTVGAFRRQYEVNKLPSKDNAKLMLQSLSAFVRLAGYRGLLILFDEAEQAYSIMRVSRLKNAHNNLLSLINNVGAIPGLFLIYATTPDFYTDPKHGIVVYGALAGRVGRPADHEPRALDTVWNLDAVRTELADYQSVAGKIRDAYACAYGLEAREMPDQSQVESFVAELLGQHPSLSTVRFWRVLTTGLIVHFDDFVEGTPRDSGEVYDDVMDRLREV